MCRNNDIAVIACTFTTYRNEDVSLLTGVSSSFAKSSMPSSSQSQASAVTSTSTDSQTLINRLCQSPPTCLFIGMELCKEETLRDWLNKCDKENTRKKKDVLEYFEQVMHSLRSSY